VQEPRAAAAGPRFWVPDGATFEAARLPAGGDGTQRSHGGLCPARDQV